MRLFDPLFMSLHFYCAVFNKRNRFDAVDSSMYYYSIAPMCIFHTSSAGKGLNVCHHITDSTGFLHQALWVSGHRWFWITSAVSVYFISSWAQSSHDTRLSIPFIMAPTTSVYVVKPVHLLRWNAEMSVNTHQIHSRMRAVYRESHWLSAHSPWFNWINLCLSGSTLHDRKCKKTAGNWEDEQKKEVLQGGWGEK